MAINEINLDQKLSNLNKVAIQIGGKKYNLSVDDELYADFVGVQAEVSAYFAELDESMTDEEFASMSQSERRDVVTGIFVDVKEKMTDVILIKFLVKAKVIGYMNTMAKKQLRYRTF